jgi:hypothetical protein
VLPNDERARIAADGVAGKVFPSIATITSPNVSRHTSASLFQIITTEPAAAVLPGIGTRCAARWHRCCFFSQSQEKASGITERIRITIVFLKWIRDYWGFLGAATSQWEPALFRNTLPVEPKTTPRGGYHLTSDLVNDAIDWVHHH